MSTGLHKDLEIAENHRIQCLEYADSTAREGATGLVSSDIGRVAHQTNDGSFWILVDDSPLTWGAITVASGIYLTEAQHKALRQLIHFIDNGPAESFASGAYRETTGTVFPTAVIWYDNNGVSKKKIVEKLISWSGAFPSTITWKVYDSAETLLATVVDTMTYSGPFETSRLRSIS
jgi:hypothetical protein